MDKIFFTPGPSQLYPTVKKNIEEALEKNIGSISHRSMAFEEIFSTTISNLRNLMNIPASHHIFFLASGTEAMERILENCVEKQSLHVVNGSFSHRFFQMAKDLGKNPKKMDAELGEGYNASTMNLELTNCELICFTHNETSTGVMQPLDPIYTLKQQYPEKLIALDIVSSAPYPKLDFRFLDCVFFSVQKFFGLPAGLGILIISPQALQKSLTLESSLANDQQPTANNLPAGNIGSYHKFSTLLHYAQKNQTHETPPVLHMYLLQKVTEDMLQIGIETIRKQTDEKAKLVYDFLDNHHTWTPFVKDKEFRSPTVIDAQVGEKANEIKKYLEEKKMIVGGGYGKNKDVQIRIANFPAISIEYIQELLRILKNFT